jgi:hypothetical protein
MATLRYTTQNVPYGPLAAALARGVAVTAAPDAALPRDVQPTLALASGCAPPAARRDDRSRRAGVMKAQIGAFARSEQALARGKPRSTRLR